MDMNRNLKELTILIIMSVLLFLVIYDMITTIFRNKKYENFTADEAIQNVSSLYNNQNMTVTNINVTGNSNLNTLKASSANITGTLTANTINGTFNGNITSGKVGSNDFIVYGTGKGYGNCTNLNPTGLTQSGLYTSNQSCFNVCPPNSFMVGIKYGKDGNIITPVCRNFN